MPAAISRRPGPPVAAWPPSLRLPAARPGRLAGLVFLLLMLWGFVGALLMGLRTPATSDPFMARLWLGGAAAIGLAGFLAGLLAAPARGG